MKILVKHYGKVFGVEIDEDCDINGVLGSFARLLLSLGFAEKTINSHMNDILEKNETWIG